MFDLVPLDHHSLLHIKIVARFVQNVCKTLFYLGTFVK